jgi:hypothetical protein
LNVQNINSENKEYRLQNTQKEGKWNYKCRNWKKNHWGKEIQNVRGTDGEKTGCLRTGSTPLLNTDNDDDYDDDSYDDDYDYPKRVIELHSADKRMTFVSQHTRRRGILRLE